VACELLLPSGRVRLSAREGRTQTHHALGPGRVGKVHTEGVPAQAPLHPEYRERFLELCHEFDSQPSVCGLGKDNLVAAGVR